MTPLHSTRRGPIRALLVEDDDADAVLFDRLVADRDEPGRIRTTRVTTLAAAVATATDARPDVVLLDLGLPDSQGLVTFEAFHAAVPDVPVVVLTGMQDHEVALLAIESGAQDYVVKDDLVAMPLDRVLAYAIERHRLQAGLVEHARVLAEQGDKLRSLFDKSLDAFLIVDDEGTVQEANPAAEAVTRRTSDELAGRRLGDLVQDLHGDALTCATLRQLGVDTVTARIPLPAGPAAEVELRLTTDVVAGEHLVSIRDVSERNLTQRQLKESEARFRDLVELADDALYRLRLVPSSGSSTSARPSRCRRASRPGTCTRSPSCGTGTSIPPTRRSGGTPAGSNEANWTAWSRDGECPTTAGRGWRTGARRSSRGASGRHPGDPP